MLDARILAFFLFIYTADKPKILKSSNLLHALARHSLFSLL
jgi:hypothetical protein